MALHTHYEVLKIARDAPQEVVRAAYRALAQRLHPDVNKSPDAEQVMKLINEAYAVLSDLQQRSEYDRWLTSQVEHSAVDEAVVDYLKRRTKFTRRTSPPTVHSPSFPLNENSSELIKEEATSTTEITNSGGFIIFGIILACLIFAGITFGVSTHNNTTQESPNEFSKAAPQLMKFDSNKELLNLICNESDINGNECLRAKNYPVREENGNACTVSLESSRIEGKFISPGKEVLLVVYRSDCEPHLMNWGGSIIFERIGTAFAFRDYQPGLVFSQCAALPNANRKDRLICDGGFLGQGYLETSLSEIVFSYDTAKKLTANYTTLVSATDSEGNKGANQVDCTAGFQLFSVESPLPGPSNNSIVFKARFADESAVIESCAPNVPLPKELNMDMTSPSENHAFIIDSKIREDFFILDLNSKEITPRVSLER